MALRIGVVLVCLGVAACGSTDSETGTSKTAHEADSKDGSAEKSEIPGGDAEDDEVEMMDSGGGSDAGLVPARLEAGAGPGQALDGGALVLPDRVSCGGAYESLPAPTDARDLPAVLETELCNFRDSRTFAVNVVKERPVRITLQNPESSDGFDITLFDNAFPLERIEVTKGETEIRLGLQEAHSLSFTPKQTGEVGIYLGLGASRVGGVFLRVEQD